jgi:hypothetical protein
VTPTVFEAAVARMTEQDAEVLAMYGDGSTTRQISSTSILAYGEVQEIIEGFTNDDRELARRLATAWRDRHPKLGQAPTKAARAKAEPKPEPVAKPEIKIELAAEPEPAAARHGYEGSVDDLIHRALNTGDTALANAAEGILAQAAKLDKRLVQHERRPALLEEQAKLKERLAQIEAELAGTAVAA